MFNDVYIPTVTMMIGLPGSGKTTWCKDLIDKDTMYINPDEIRIRKFGDVMDMSNNIEVFKIAGELLDEGLAFGKDIILDATNVNRKIRAIAIDKCRGKAKVVGVFLDIDYDEAVKRQDKREHKIPNDVIRKMYYDLEAPRYSEGFDDIIIVDENGSCKQLNR